MRSVTHAAYSRPPAILGRWQPGEAALPVCQVRIRAHSCRPKGALGTFHARAARGSGEVGRLVGLTGLRLGWSARGGADG